MASRHMRKGIARLYYNVADTLAVATLFAGNYPATGTAKDLTVQLESITGFEFQNQPIMTPDMAGAYTTQIGGEDTAPASSMTFYELDGGIANNPLQSALAKGNTGFIYLVPKVSGLNAGYPLPTTADTTEKWPITITSNSRQWSAGNDPARFVVAFSVTAPPAINVAFV